MDAAEGTTRRRRRRATSPQGSPAARPAASAEPTGGVELTPDPEPSVGAAQPLQPPAVASSTPARRSRTQKRDPAERAMQDLIGGGRSQLGVSGALRGRDVNRPSEEDLAEAERTTTIVRRNWKPAPNSPADQR